MQIIKRSGRTEPYCREKIFTAIKKCTVNSERNISEEAINEMTNCVEKFLVGNESQRSVERIQDEVERVLMAHGFYAEAKSYILYRWTRSEKRKILETLSTELKCQDILPYLHSIQSRFAEDIYSIGLLAEKFIGVLKPSMDQDERIGLLIKSAVELTSQDAPQWEYIASELLVFKLTRRIKILENRCGLHSLYDKLWYLTQEGLYGTYILDQYTKEEIDIAETFIVNDRNRLLNYSGVHLLVKRYLICTHSKEVIESIQEMFLGIALHLAMLEKITAWNGCIVFTIC